MRSLTCVPWMLAAITVPLPAAVQAALNGKPAVAGDYKPADVNELVLRNGLLSIAFGGDGSASA
jgi:tetrahydromethanopterin S-methyltransferase subunit C